jgi:ferric-dicitrate binding protein FerR (iron transport regulator)
MQTNEASHTGTLGIASELVRWAAECRSAANSEADANARAAYTELATEFEAVGTEIEGLLASLEALQARRGTATAEEAKAKCA